MMRVFALSAYDQSARKTDNRKVKITETPKTTAFVPTKLRTTGKMKQALILCLKLASSIFSDLYVEI